MRLFRSRVRSFCRDPLWVAATLYLVGVTSAELFTTYTDPRIGMLTHCLLLVTLVFHAFRAPDRETQSLLVSLLFAPLIRILSLSLPLTRFPLMYWYLLTSIPLFVSLFVTGRALGFSWRNLGLNLRRWPLQLLVAASGLLFGTVEYLILRPVPLIQALTWANLWWPALILLFSTGLLEEMLFRGLIQRTAEAGLGRWGMLYVALLFGVLHIGYRSFVDVAFVLIVGLFFGWIVQRTRSLIGVTLAHGLTNVMLFLVMPFWSWANPLAASDPLPVVLPTPTAIEARVPTAIAPSPTPPFTATPTARPPTPRATATATPSATPVPPSPTPPVEAVVLADGVNVRAGPATSYAVVGRVDSSESYAIVGRNAGGDWWLICCVDEQEGWIFGELIRVEGNPERVPVVPGPAP